MSAEKESPLQPYDPLLEKAERFLRSAKILSDEGDFDSAASRLYYAMLFAAEALLEARGFSFSSHRATISAFGQHFAKTKELDPTFHQALLSAFSQRQLGDYAIHSGIRKEDIDTLLSQSTAFLKAARNWLENHRS
jgi:uncharacterized protein (UPF0332 family)